MNGLNKCKIQTNLTTHIGKINIRKTFKKNPGFDKNKARLHEIWESEHRMKFDVGL